MRKSQFVFIAAVVLALGGGWFGYTVFTPPALGATGLAHPVVTLTQAIPLTEQPGLFAAVWTIDFAPRLQPAPAVSHAEDREVWVTKGTMLVSSTDIPGGVRTMRMGEKITIGKGAMHQWMNVGSDAGAIVATGLVEQVKLHDACGGAGG